MRPNWAGAPMRWSYAIWAGLKKNGPVAVRRADVWVAEAGALSRPLRKDRLQNRR